MAQTVVYHGNPNAAREVLALAAPLVAKAQASAYQAARKHYRRNDDRAPGRHIVAPPVEVTGMGRPRAVVIGPADADNALLASIFAASW